MSNNSRPVNSIEFLKKLPAFYARGSGGGDPLFQSFLMQFEELFDGLEAAIAGDALTLTYKGSGEHDSSAEAESYLLPVELFDAGHRGYPKSSLVFIPGDSDTTMLAEPIEANGKDASFIRVTDRTFPKRLKPGDRFVVRTSSGLAGLTSIRETLPPAFENPGEADKLAYLQYIASWVGLPLRSDKPLSWNRRFLREAVAMDDNPSTLRSTLPGIKAMLNSWHHEEIDDSKTIVTDLVPLENDVEDTVFRLGESRIGVNTCWGKGQKGLFYVYLTADPDDVYMRNPRNINAMTAAAELMLDLEKPAGTAYTLHIHAHTMCLAPDAPIAASRNATGSDDELNMKDTNTFARIGVTTLLWGV